MQKKEVLDLAKEAFREFPFSVQCPRFAFLTRKKFKSYLQNSLLEMHLEQTPAIVVHLAEGELICFCMEIMEKFLKKESKENQKQFVKAVTMHELFHVWNHYLLSDGKAALHSEAKVHQEIKKYFSNYYQILKRHEDENRLNIQRRMRAEDNKPEMFKLVRIV